MRLAGSDPFGRCLADPDCLKRLRTHWRGREQVGTADDFYDRSTLETYLRHRGHSFDQGQLLALLRAPLVMDGGCLPAKSVRASESSEPTWSQLQSLEGRAFELALQQLFVRLGYRVEMTPDSNDLGADLVLEKDNIRTVVQAKRYRDTVGITAVQEVVASVKVYGAHRAYVVTTSSFTPQAARLAEANDVRLLDSNALRPLWDAAGLD